MDRPTCLYCTLKHLGQAHVIQHEILKGHKENLFSWVMVAHMAEAEDECVKEFPLLASAIRAQRERLRQDPGWTIDFMDLIRAADDLYGKDPDWLKASRKVLDEINSDEAIRSLDPRHYGS